MGKSYKICPCDLFDDRSFQTYEFSLDGQKTLFTGSDNPNPDTKILKSYLGTILDDFESYKILHEHNVKASGRIHRVNFDYYIRRGDILGFYSEPRNLLLLSGNRNDVLDFCRYTAGTSTIKIKTLEVDMNRLQEKLDSISVAWFRFKAGMITASGLMGTHIEQTQQFNEAKKYGELTTLAFDVVDRDGRTHPVMVTQLGTVIPVMTYQDLSEAIALVLEVKKNFLDGLYVEVPVKIRKSSRRSA